LFEEEDNARFVFVCTTTSWTGYLPTVNYDILILLKRQIKYSPNEDL